MSRLVETIRIENGSPVNIAFHNERMLRTRSDLFGISEHLDLRNVLSVPPEAGTGIFKCRVEYDSEIRKIEYLPYEIRPVSSLKLLVCDDISYSYKFTERNMIDSLYERRGEADDILIIKEGMITDTSYANVVLIDYKGRLVTPSTFLLAGTRRASLLRSGQISEKKITAADLKNYRLLKLINAMIGPDDTAGIPVNNIF